MGIDALSMASGIDLQTTAKSISDNKEVDDFKLALEKAKSDDNPEEIKKVCQQFEAIFVNMLLKQMRNTITEGGLTEKSQARETFEGMLDEEMSRTISEGGGFGIAEMMTKALSRSYYNDQDEIQDVEKEDVAIDDQIFKLLGDQ